MFFKPTDDHGSNIEKRITTVEKKVDKNLRLAQSSVGLIVKTMEKLALENTELKKERDKLLARQEELQQELEKTTASFKINETLVEPFKQKVAENVAFVQNVAKEGFEKKTKDESPSIDKIKKRVWEKTGRQTNGFPDDVYLLYHLIEKNKSMRVDNAAWSMRVHPLQALRWCNTLQDDGLVNVIREKTGKYVVS
ncbi:MAG: hypothetical protein HY832_00910, partial [Candidatus Aenigmarchaeota archaeon]|nr:hypothetical protein [Candidatus Aenigmarchaeota archaeon]